jgi:hypothetical protein
VSEHVCPYCEHVVPPSAGGGFATPHVPFVEPVGTLHGSPEQQSASIVHSPLVFTHVPSHTLFTQGLPQQSALVAHFEPGGTTMPSLQTKFTARQRGMPSASREQHASGLLLQNDGPGAPPSGRSPSQQSFDVPPHAPDAALQTSPGRRHWRNSQRPNVSPVGTVHVFGALGSPPAPFTRPVGRPGPPQQSLSALHSSFCGLQPEGG